MKCAISPEEDLSDFPKQDSTHIEICLKKYTGVFHVTFKYYIVSMHHFYKENTKHQYSHHPEISTTNNWHIFFYFFYSRLPICPVSFQFGV